MRTMICAMLCGLVSAGSASAENFDSLYTRLDHSKDCELVKRDPESGFSDLRCPGVAGYSYLLRSTDGRESVSYGYGDEPGMATFSAFNYAGGTVEWRIEARDRNRPLAAIQRWFVADGDGEWSTQILVVSRVAQPDDAQTCVMGYVDASDGAPANLRARAIADRVSGFECTRDRPAVEAGIAAFVPPPR